MATRIRTRSADPVTRDMYLYRSCGSYFSSCSDDLHRVHGYTPLFESMEDVVTLEFERKKNEGKIINSPMEKTSTLWHHEYGALNSGYAGLTGIPDSWKETSFDIEATYYLPWTLVPTAAAIDEENLIDIAVAQAHANRSQAEFQALVTAAEARKTVDSVGSILGRIFRILKQIKRLEYRKLKKEIKLDELQDRYLEARYAIRPLIYDFEQAATAWNSQLPQRQTSRGFASDTSVKEDSGSYIAHSSRTEYYEASQSIVTKVRAGVLDELHLDTLDEHLSVWGMDSFAESAWELVPFSFIVDWFFNVGDTIAAWTPKRGLTKLASWYTLERVTTERLAHVSSSANIYDSYWTGKDTPITTFISGTPVATCVTTYKERVPDPSIPAIPTFDLNVDTLKIIDLLAIARKSLLK